LQIGGDFNTIICRDAGVDNLDREGAGRIPNRQNSLVINEWIANGTLLDPFRVLYPERKEVSHIPFRTQPNGNRQMFGSGKSRLDFFLISPSLLDSVKEVNYEDRLGSDFDHKEVVLKMGNRERGKRVTIYDSTINDVMADVKVTFIVYESIVSNLTVRDVEIDENLMQLNILINEKEVLECRITNEGENTELRDRLDINGINIQLIKDRLPALAVILDREFGCNYRILYEGVILYWVLRMY
jgi:hypothetical protein